MSIVNIGKWLVHKDIKQVTAQIKYLPGNQSNSLSLYLANTILNNWKALDFYSVPFYWSTQNNKTTIRYAGYTRQPDDVIIHGDLENDELKFVAYYLVDDKVQAVAQSKYDPLTSEIAEIFYQKKTIRKNDIENDLFGYKKYL